MADSKFIIRGPRENVTYPSVSLGEYLMGCMLKHGDGVAQIQEVEGKTKYVTFLELVRQGKKIGKFLQEKSVKPGDTVWINCINTLDFAPIMLGTLFIGATVAPVNPFFDASDMSHLLDVMRPAIVLCNSVALEAMTEALAQSKYSNIPLVGVKSVIHYSLEAEEVSDFQIAHLEDGKNDVPLVLCSSGTSGKPKGVELTHKSIYPMFDVPIYRYKGDFSGKVALNMSGPYWVSCILATIISLGKGMTLVLLNGFTTDKFLETVQKFKVNFTLTGPDQVVQLAKCPNIHEYDTSSLIAVTYGGAPTSAGVVALLRSKLKTEMLQLYGLTECMGTVVPFSDTMEQIGSVGVVYSNCEAKIVDLTTGQTVGRNNEGEICFRSPSAMKGYRNNPEATAAIFDEDGFIHTGDVGYFDEDDFLFVKDRIKELIKYKRDHVPAIDIEEVLLSHPDISEAAVVGVFHEIDWEHATGFVVLKPGSTATEKDVLTMVESRLPQSKWLHGGVKFVASIPKTQSGKIQKRVLRETLKTMN